ncbi:hypothetical protein BWQ96_07331 [Gracilariopsis chorda]|uniref:Uncharacterized protein n=1 Tax=Gracilariopsis chorda TaxID=448386 RepID=A0A2V3ILM1_9FLOR|nr:hypothetical protein BWQ96_07331 [Gracilariopsis chorda]|eukprot:PXF42953.1 hypothetical protein BWQ96_07331 [Gracilariopsis chorda]
MVCCTTVLSDEIAEAGDDACLDETNFKGTLITNVMGLFEVVRTFAVPITLAHEDLYPMSVIHNSNGGIDCIGLRSTCISFPFTDAVNFAIGGWPSDLFRYVDGVREPRSDTGTMQDCV